MLGVGPVIAIFFTDNAVIGKTLLNQMPHGCFSGPVCDSDWVDIGDCATLGLVGHGHLGAEMGKNGGRGRVRQLIQKRDDGLHILHRLPLLRVEEFLRNIIKALDDRSGLSHGWHYKRLWK